MAASLPGSWCLVISARVTPRLQSGRPPTGRTRLVVTWRHVQAEGPSGVVCRRHRWEHPTLNPRSRLPDPPCAASSWPHWCRHPQFPDGLVRETWGIRPWW